MKFEFLQNGLYGGISEHIDKNHLNYNSNSNIIKVKTKTLSDALESNNCLLRLLTLFQLMLKVLSYQS